jgi:hypothetical protein
MEKSNQIIKEINDTPHAFSSEGEKILFAEYIRAETETSNQSIGDV